MRCRGLKSVQPDSAIAAASRLSRQRRRRDIRISLLRTSCVREMAPCRLPAPGCVVRDPAHAINLGLLFGGRSELPEVAVLAGLNAVDAADSFVHEPVQVA